MADIVKTDAPYAEFAKRLRSLREASGLTRDELAKKCGVVSRTIVNYETGERIPYADVAAKIASVFGLTVEDLLGMENPEVEQIKAQSLEELREMYGKRGMDQARALLDGTTSLLAGGTLTKEQQEDFIFEMQKAFIMATEIAKKRYTPRKYRDAEKEAASKERLRKLEEIDRALSEKNANSLYWGNNEN